MSIRAIRPILLKRGRNRKTRPKSFSTAKAAQDWATQNKVEEPTIVKNASGKKFLIR